MPQIAGSYPRLRIRHGQHKVPLLLGERPDGLCAAVPETEWLSSLDDKPVCDVREMYTFPLLRGLRYEPASGSGLIRDGEPAMQPVKGQLQRRLHKGIWRERHWMAHPQAK